MGIKLEPITSEVRVLSVPSAAENSLVLLLEQLISISLGGGGGGQTFVCPEIARLAHQAALLGVEWLD